MIISKLPDSYLILGLGECHGADRDYNPEERLRCRFAADAAM
jgi:hypothetical protein